MQTVMPDVETMIEMVIIRQKNLRINDNQDLFVYTSTSKRNEGAFLRLVAKDVYRNISKFIKRNIIKGDDGDLLKLNIMRLRKTFANRIFQLSGGDPWITAKHNNHSLRVSDSHYLEAPLESKKNFRLLGEIRVNELKNDPVNEPSIFNTPVAKCKDTKYGHHAPKNGQHCAEFLSCFRCRSFVVTKDDLYRLFSLYWLLIKEREISGKVKWNRYYSHIIRIVDLNISPQFSLSDIRLVREKARLTPHPFWLSHEQLSAGFGS